MADAPSSPPAGVGSSGGIFVLTALSGEVDPPQCTSTTPAVSTAGLGALAELTAKDLHGNEKEGGGTCVADLESVATCEAMHTDETACSNTAGCLYDAAASTCGYPCSKVPPAAHHWHRGAQHMLCGDKRWPS